MIHFIGIDPGVTGAVAVIDENGGLVSLQDTPTIVVKKPGGGKRTAYVESQMAALLLNGSTVGDHTLVTIENVHSMPKQGVSSSFNFGMGFGIWLGVCAAMRLPLERVEPTVWKKAMHLPAGSDKNTSVLLASRLFPSASLDRKKDDGRGDALLIAEFARRRYQNGGSQ